VRVRAADARTKGLTDPAVKLVNGAVTEGGCHALALEGDASPSC
jgi:hypothetical protein